MFIDDQIANLTRRIKNIGDNPDPRYMKCNKLLYEVERDEWQEIKDNWQAGKPFAMLGNAGRLTGPLGFATGLGLSGWGDRATDPWKYLDIAVNKFGFPEHTCDRTIIPVGVYLSGDAPLPKVMASMCSPCEPERISAMAIAKYLGILFFELTRGENAEDNGEANIHYMAEQFAELIEFCEKSIAGIKYNEEKLIAGLERDRLAAPYIRDLYELRKRVPCPVSSQDVTRLGLLPGGDDDPRGLEYLKQYHEEMFERAEKGMSGVAEEKLRILWTATFNYGRGTMDLLAKKGVSLVWFNNGTGPLRYGIGGFPHEVADVIGRKLTPLEEIAARSNLNTWGSTADRWIDPIIKISRDLKVDAIVDFQQVGCIVTKGFNKITAERVRDELGIPLLALEGRERFMRDGERDLMYKRLDEFLDMCIANKN